MSTNRLRIGILGASGYTGAELVRLLARHPQVEIRLLTADRQAGKPLAEVFPQFGHLKLPTLLKIEDADWSGIDVAFCCLPHGTTQEVIANLPRHLKVVDLSADFRLADLASYAQWYGHAGDDQEDDQIGGDRLDYAAQGPYEPVLRQQGENEDGDRQRRDQNICQPNDDCCHYPPREGGVGHGRIGTEAAQQPAAQRPTEQQGGTDGEEI